MKEFFEQLNQELDAFYDYMSKKYKFFEGHMNEMVKKMDVWDIAKVKFICMLFGLFLGQFLKFGVLFWVLAFFVYIKFALDLIIKLKYFEILKKLFED